MAVEGPTLVSVPAHCIWSAGRPVPLAFLPRFLFTDRGPVWRYVLLGLPLVVVPTLLLGWTAYRLFPNLAGPAVVSDAPLWLTVVLIVLVSPFLETLLMTGPVILLDRWLGPVPAVVGSALLWGVAHSLAAARWGLVIWWPFLIFSIAYLTWRDRGYWRAVGVVVALHALNNAAPMAAVVIGAA